MKKHLITAAIVVLAVTPALAQPSVKTDTTVNVIYSADKFKVETNHFKYDWFINVGGGAQIYFGDHDKQAKFGDRLAPALNISVGKWFTPAVGARIAYNGLSMRGATQQGPDEAFSTGKEVPGKGGSGYWLNKQKFSFGDVRMDAMLNLCNAFHGYKAEGRFWNPSLYAGLGFAWTYDEPGNGKSRSHEVSASIGTSNDFRLSDAWAINLDVRGMFVNDRFDGEMGHRWGEGVLSATIGLTYNIAPRGWNKSKTVVKTVNNNIADFQKALSESEAERIRLEKELGELRAQPQIVEKQTTIAAPYFVIFEINKSKLSKDSRVNLGMLAEIIKANNIKYIVTGYADAATGNKKINDKLSRKRAEAVYECLTKEFGVPESLLEIGHKGGVENMFYDDPALSRAAITKAL